jgi:hypothetical protein
MPSGKKISAAFDVQSPLFVLLKYIASQVKSFVRIYFRCNFTSFHYSSQQEKSADAMTDST